jgi:hypothetical protein
MAKKLKTALATFLWHPSNQECQVKNAKHPVGTLYRWIRWYDSILEPCPHMSPMVYTDIFEGCQPYKLLYGYLYIYIYLGGKGCQGCQCLIDFFARARLRHSFGGKLRPGRKG